MNKQISTYDELLKEKQRLQLQLEVHKAALHHQVDEIKEKLNPVKGVLSFMSNFTNSPTSNTLLGSGLNLSLELLLRKFLFARAGFITRLLGPILVKNFSANILKKKGNLLKKIKSIFHVNGKSNQ